MIKSTLLHFSQNRRRVLALLLAAMLWINACAYACPNCKNAQLESGEEASSRMREGYFWSYVVMSSMPFAAVGSVAAFLVFQARRQKVLRQSGGEL
jgi:hypothetical protein